MGAALDIVWLLGALGLIAGGQVGIFLSSGAFGLLAERRHEGRVTNAQTRDQGLAIMVWLGLASAWNLAGCAALVLFFVAF